MKKLLLAATMLSALASGANAVTLGLDPLDWNTAGAAVLQLTPVIPNNNQPRNLPCIICGATQPQQPDGFGYDLFGNQGNLATLPYFSTSVVGGSLAPDTFGGVSSGYSIADGSAFLTALAGSLNFSIGVDSNQSGSNSQILESFWFLNFTTHTVLGVFSPEPGGSPIDPPNNGTGFPDYTITGLSLAGIAAGDRIGFFARITNANDGPDSFFLVPSGAINEVPIPGALVLFLSGLFGLGGLELAEEQKGTGGVNLATVILALVMATAFVAIHWMRETLGYPSDTTLLALALVLGVFGGVMFFKCGGMWCSLGK